MDQEDRGHGTNWHLDKRFPISLMVAIVLQTMGLVYVGTTWKSDIDHRLISLEKTVDALSPQDRRIIILEQQYQFILGTLQRIENKIDRKESP